MADDEVYSTVQLLLSHGAAKFIQVGSGMGAYAGAARRRVHLATVILRPPSGHRPGTRQARHSFVRTKRTNVRNSS